MAGGMSAGGGIPMSRRVALTARLDECPARHCWVSDAADGAGVKRPGLLVEWRPGHTGWEGRVVYVAELRAGTWALVEEWVASALLTPR